MLYGPMGGNSSSQSEQRNTMKIPVWLKPGIWGVILGAMEVLPRVGYAKGDALHPATWVCK